MPVPIKGKQLLLSYMQNYSLVTQRVCGNIGQRKIANEAIYFWNSVN